MRDENIDQGDVSEVSELKSGMFVGDMF